MRDPVRLITQGTQELGSIFALGLGPKRAVVVADSAQARTMLSLPESVLGVAPVYQWLRPMFGPVMQAAPVPDYHQQRSALLPALRSSELDRYSTVMTEQAQRWFDRLGSSGTMDLAAELERTSTDIAMTLFLGSELTGRHGEQLRSLLRDVAAGVNFFLPEGLPIPRLRRRNAARQQLLRLCRPALALAHERAGDPALGFLGYLTTSGELADELVLDLCLLLVYAAFETTTAHMAWLAIELLHAPEPLGKVREEAADQDGAPGLQRRLPYLQACSSEVQRLRSVTTMLTRAVLSEFQFSGYRIPAGWQVLVCPPVSHRDPAIYPDPDLFRPQRYLAVDGQPPEADRMLLLNQGAGLHACLGAAIAEREIAAVIGGLLHRFDLSVPDRPARSSKPGVAKPAGAVMVDYQSRR
jgi:sterol 14-demethylase